MRIAVPNKGRLHEPTLSLLERAGLHVENGSDRKLYADTVDPDVQVLFARAADIPAYVADGAAAVGVTGRDQVHEHEHGADLEELLDLEFGRCRLVLASPEDGPIRETADLEGGTVATEFPNVTRTFFEGTEVSPDIVEVSGATELTPHVDMADAIVDITSTGTTLRMNRLAIVDEVLQSSVRLYAHPDRVDDEKVRQVETALASVLAAEGKRYLMMNVPSDSLADVEDVIPGMGGPTVMEVDSRASETPGEDGEAADGQDAVAVHVVVDEREVFETITRLKEAGARDVLVTEIERLVE
ncbi:ATP phosphoribosyltransferase [Haloglomus salinum]|jgi:ATP phosphoribosyltransferase|uniref:ATP phosphoribosyltransferase n=1 Tax=Haloglomus salinum TaxID=2962673 RepID=UPI0020C9BC29|nr:ATP phosphoribosyltransferase [Haloglomus salinum]